MPTYEYRCPSGHVFERSYQKMTDKRHVACPTCGKRAERQISGGGGLVFKGSGFYATDYKRGADKADKKEKAESESRRAEAESKPAEKSAAEKSPSKKDSSSDS